MDENSAIWSAIGIVAVAICGWLVKITHMLSNLAERYVPRSEINRRFDKIAEEMHDRMQGIENRSEKRFDSIDTKLDKILEKVDSKMDKQ